MAAVTTAQAAAAAAAIIDRWAPDVPADVRTVAVARLSSWLERFPDSGTLQVSLGSQSVSHAPAVTAALRGSGAAELLAPWRRPRARALEARS